MVEVELVGLEIGFTVEVKMTMVKVKAEKAAPKVPKLAGRAVVGEGWRDVGVINEVYGVSWTLYAKIEKNYGWRALKLAANGKAPHKANYWLNWNGERLAQGGDLRKLKNGKPELLDMLLEHIDRTPGL